MINQPTTTSRLLIIILAGLSMVGALSIDAYLPALPTIAQHFGTTEATSQQTLSIYLLSFAIMTLFNGTLSDTFGRRLVILVSLTGYALSSIGAALSTSMTQLLLFRFFQGLTAGAGPIIGRAIVGDLHQGAEAQRMMSLISIFFGLAPALAPILGGWLLSLWGWRSIFIFLAAFTSLMLLLSVRFLPETLAKEDRHPLHFKTLLKNYLHVGAHKLFLLQALAIAFSFLGVMIYIASAPTFVIHLLHLPVTQFGWLFIPLIGGMTLGSIVASNWSKHRHPTFILRTSYGIMICSAVVNVLYNLSMEIKIPWAIFPLFTYAFGVSLAMPALTVMCLELFPQRRGLAASLQSFVFMIIFSAASGLLSPLLGDSALKLSLVSLSASILSVLCYLAGKPPSDLKS